MRSSGTILLPCLRGWLVFSCSHSSFFLYPLCSRASSASSFLLPRVPLSDLIKGRFQRSCRRGFPHCPLGGVRDNLLLPCPFPLVVFGPLPPKHVRQKSPSAPRPMKTAMPPLTMKCPPRKRSNPLPNLHRDQSIKTTCSRPVQR